MIRSILLCALYFSIPLLSACAAVSMQSQMAPGITLVKSDALYLGTSSNMPIPHQKYIETLRKVLNEQEFHLVKNKTQAHYIMTVHFDDFSAPLTQTVPNTQTTTYNGNIGTTPINSTSTTVATREVTRHIPTHNSRISVTERKSGNPIWEASMAKSYDVYNHKSLKHMIEKMISLYGRDEKTTQMVGDQVRW